MRTSSLFTFLVLALVPVVALAVAIQPADFYDDVRTESSDAAGINYLTRAGIVQGYGDRIFGASRHINRAEFLKIAMQSGDMTSDYPALFCFPDVMVSDWFSPFVCAAKARGIVKGKNFPPRSDFQLFFDPSASVTYGEALKMLSNIFSLSTTPVNAAHWAETYYQAAKLRGLDLPITINLDTPLTRGHAARLVAAFFAEEHGQLAELRLAEAGKYGSSSSSSSSVSSSSTSSSASSSSTSFLMDPLSDTQARSQFLLLGETGPMLGAGKIFLAEEPLLVTSITVNLVAEASTVHSLLVYDDQRQLLGRATLDPTVSSNRAYKLTLIPGRFTAANRKERSIYVRPVLLSKDLGGLSNQLVQISSIVVKGTGEWSSQAYTSMASSTNSYQPFQTSRSIITSVTNASVASAGLVLGTNRELGSFTVTGRTSDSLAKVNIVQLVFTIQQTGGVTVTNSSLAVDGINEKFTCSVNATTLTCDDIPEPYGSATDAPRTFTLYGTVSATDTAHASFQLALNTSGTFSSAGDIEWNDGTTTFNWLPFFGSIASGTRFQY